MFAVTLSALSLILAVNAVDFRISNHASGPIRVGTLGNAGKPALNGGQFVMDAGAELVVNAPDDWAGRFWANPCTYNGAECQIGGSPPTSLAEITLGGAGGSGTDFYDISLVDGFNIQIQFGPIGVQGDGSQYSCQEARCTADINGECPDELRFYDSNGRTIACVSACAAFGTDEYCCRGEHDRPETCKSSDWVFDYPQFFKTRCPDAYSYAYDDNRSTYTCPSAPLYEIIFG